MIPYAKFIQFTLETARIQTAYLGYFQIDWSLTGGMTEREKRQIVELITDQLQKEGYKPNYISIN